MLVHEYDIKYLVYPSWAEGGYAYSWRELPNILAHPETSGRMSNYADRIRQQPEIFNPPAHLIDGPAGGGIIVIGPAPPEALNVVLFRDVANIGFSDEMRRARSSFPTYVGYIEPFSGVGGLLMTGKRARIYPVRATAEHMDSVEDDVYWMFCVSDLREGRSSFDSVPLLASGFGLIAEPLSKAPNEVDREIRQTFGEGIEQHRLFRVHGSDQTAGRNFAVLLYIALHLKKGVRGLRWAHLIAQIEGNPRPRRTAAGTMHPTPDGTKSTE